MNPTTTLTAKGQVTIPKAIRVKLGLRRGTKLSVIVQGGQFVMSPQKDLLILKHRGLLAPYDDGRPLREIRAEAQRRAAREIVKRAKR